MTAECQDKDFIIESQRKQINLLHVESENLRKERDELLAQLQRLTAFLEKSRSRKKCFDSSTGASPKDTGGRRAVPSDCSHVEARLSNTGSTSSSRRGRGSSSGSGSALMDSSTAAALADCRQPTAILLGRSTTMPALPHEGHAADTMSCTLDQESTSTSVPVTSPSCSVRGRRRGAADALTSLPPPPVPYRGSSSSNSSSSRGVTSSLPGGSSERSRGGAAPAMPSSPGLEMVTGIRSPGPVGWWSRDETANGRARPSEDQKGSRLGWHLKASDGSLLEMPALGAVTAAEPLLTGSGIAPGTSWCDAAHACASAGAHTCGRSPQPGSPADPEGADIAPCCDDVLSPPSPYNSSLDDSSDSEDAPCELPEEGELEKKQGAASLLPEIDTHEKGSNGSTGLLLTRRSPPPQALGNGGYLSGLVSVDAFRSDRLPASSWSHHRRRGSVPTRRIEGDGVDDRERQPLAGCSAATGTTSSLANGCIYRLPAAAAAAAASPATTTAWSATVHDHRRSSAPHPWSALAASSAGNVSSVPSEAGSDGWRRVRRHRRRRSADGGGSSGRRSRASSSYCRYCSSSGGSCRHSSSASTADVEKNTNGEVDEGDDDEVDEVEAESSDTSSDDGDGRGGTGGGGDANKREVDSDGAESYRRAGSVGANRLSDVIVAQSGRSGRVTERERKRQYRIGLNLFNRKPELGLRYLMEQRFLENSAQAVAHFLLTRKGLSRLVIGEYLGNLQQAFNQEVLRCFVVEIDFTCLELDEALRKFVALFQLPGEAQKIERIMEVFSQQYCACNPDFVKSFKSPDMIFLITFSVIMLNTDLHNPNIKSHRRMKVESFIANVKGIDGGDDLSPQFLSAIYQRIRENELRTAVDHTTQVRKVEETMVGKCPVLSLPWRRLVCYCRLYEVHNAHKRGKPGSHQREVFLFNDMLVVTKIFAKKKGCITYSFRESMDLSDLLVSPFETECYRFGIHLMSKSDHRLLMLFNARNEHDREKFVEDVCESICEVCQTETLLAREELRRTTSLGKFSKDSGCVADVEFAKPSGSVLGRHEDAGSSAVDCVSAATSSSERLNCNSFTDLSCNGATLT